MKNAVRKQKKEQRSRLSKSELKSLSEAVCNKLISVDEIRKASCIMAYYPFGNEPDILPFVDWCIKKGKKVAMPCVTGEGVMKAVSSEPGCEMKNNIYGIPEPYGTCDIAPEDIDVAIVPGAAFDLNGTRIGSGCGYYDRFLSRLDIKKIGVCFDFQIVDSINNEEHDIGMDMVVTDLRVVETK